MNEFSFFGGGIKVTKPTKTINVVDFVVLVRHDAYKETCEKLVAITDKKERDKLKTTLDYVTPAATFSKREKNGVIAPSGLAIIDIDDVPNLKDMKKKLSIDPYVYVLFISPSGKGIKIFIRVPPDIEKYSSYVVGFYKYLNEKYGIPFELLDEPTKDISRACFLSHDPDIVFNKKNSVFDILIEPEKIDPHVNKEADGSRSGKEFGAVMRLLTKGKTKDEIFKVMGLYAKWSEPGKEAYRETTYKNALELFERKSTELNLLREEEYRAQDEDELNLFKEISRLFVENVPEAIHQIVNHILCKFKIVTLEDDTICIYKDGVYVPEAEINIKIYLYRTILEPQLSIHKLNELMFAIRNRTYIKSEESKNICLLNGVYDLQTGQFGPHSPDQIFFSKLPLFYDASADCPSIKKFITEIVRPDDIPVLQELIGYCLLKSYPFHRAFMFVGEGANGKSTFITLLKTMLGQEHCCSIPLQVLDKSRFAIAELYLKLVNMYADLPSETLTSTAYFKQLTGEDNITAEQKFKPHFNFVNYAKLIFSCNRVPISTDDTDAFHRRWVIINFPNQFLEGQNANPHIITQLTTQAELSGMFNWALAGLAMVLSQRTFTGMPTIAESREKWVRLSDSVGSFCMDMVLSDPSNHISKDELYHAYVEYCKAKKYPLLEKHVFGRVFIKKQNACDAYIYVAGKRMYCWRGIRLNIEKGGLTEFLSKDVQAVQAVHALSTSKENLQKDIRRDISKEKSGGKIGNCLHSLHCPHTDGIYEFGHLDDPGRPEMTKEGCYIIILGRGPAGIRKEELYAMAPEANDLSHQLMAEGRIIEMPAGILRVVSTNAA